MVRLLLLGLGLGLALGACGDDSSVPPEDFGGCDGLVEVVANEPGVHMPVGSHIDWSSNPPAVGAHYATWAGWNRHYQSLDRAYYVHNLEHGGIVIQYGDRVSQAERDKLNAYYDKDPVGILMAPLPRIGPRIAVTAWTHLMVCQKVDTKAFDTFKKKYRFKGPEKIPADQMQPGQ